MPVCGVKCGKVEVGRRGEGRTGRSWAGCATGAASWRDSSIDESVFERAKEPSGGCGRAQRCCLAVDPQVCVRRCSHTPQDAKLPVTRTITKPSVPTMPPDRPPIACAWLLCPFAIIISRVGGVGADRAMGGSHDVCKLRDVIQKAGALQTGLAYGRNVGSRGTAPGAAPPPRGGLCCGCSAFHWDLLHA